MNVVCDFETRSRIDIRKEGVYNYAWHESTDVICFALKVDEELSVIWSPWLKPEDRKAVGVPRIICDEELRDIMRSADSLSAHNAAFERLVWNAVMTRSGYFDPIPLEKWHCTAAQAAACALPRDLDRLSKALSLSTTKDKEGHKVMMRISKPNSKGNWIEKHELFVRVCRYCVIDVEVEYLVEHALPALPPKERDIWLLDQQINDRGIFVDYEGAKEIYKHVKAEETRILANVLEMTEGKVSSARQVAKSLAWLKEQGIELEDMKKGTVSDALEASENDLVSQFLTARQSLGKASVAKIPALLRAVCTDSRLRGTTLYHGASTGRWTGRMFQPQNLPRESFKTDEEVDAVIEGNIEGCPILAASKCLRGLITAAPGKQMVAADEKSIEARVTAWLADERTALDVFFNDQDPYKVAASGIYNVPYEEVTKDQRQIGKVAELALGYQGWVSAFQTMAVGYGVSLLSEDDIENARRDYALNIAIEVKIKAKNREGKEVEKWVTRPCRHVYKTPEDFIQYRTDLVAAEIIKAWRSNRPMTVALWKGMEDAAFKTVKTGKKHRYGRIMFGIKDQFLCMKLPSGRLLRYPYPEIQKRDTKYVKGKDVVTFMGENTYTRKWERLTTYGGKLTENAVQAISRDILAEAMLDMDTFGHEIVFHVHDEIVEETFHNSVKAVERIMGRVPDWAKGCPIGAEGWIGKRYKKG